MKCMHYYLKHVLFIFCSPVHEYENDTYSFACDDQLTMRLYNFTLLWWYVREEFSIENEAKLKFNQTWTSYSLFQVSTKSNHIYSKYIHHFFRQHHKLTTAQELSEVNFAFRVIIYYYSIHETKLKNIPPRKMSDSESEDKKSKWDPGESQSKKT